MAGRCCGPPPVRAEQVRADPQVQTCSQNLRVSGVSGNCLWRVPCFHENALLRGGGPDDGLADNAASLAGGEDRDATTLEAAFRLGSWRGHASMLASAY